MHLREKILQAIDCRQGNPPDNPTLTRMNKQSGSSPVLREKERKGREGRGGKERDKITNLSSISPVRVTQSHVGVQTFCKAPGSEPPAQTIPVYLISPIVFVAVGIPQRALAHRLERLVQIVIARKDEIHFRQQLQRIRGLFSAQCLLVCLPTSIVNLQV